MKLEAFKINSLLNGTSLLIVRVGLRLPYSSIKLGLALRDISYPSLSTEQELSLQSSSYLGPQNVSIPVPYQYKNSLISTVNFSTSGALNITLNLMVSFNGVKV